MTELFLAKSSGETIITHTQNLMKNLQCLRSLYPEIPVNWDLLELACKYHDLGKMNHLFQEKLREGTLKKTGEIPHGLLSISLLPIKALKATYSKQEIKSLAYAVALHHERNFSDIDYEQYVDEIARLSIPSDSFPFTELGLSRPEEIKKVAKQYYALGHRLGSADPAFKDYVKLKGLLNKIDYAASGDYPVEYPADFLEKNLPKLLEKWSNQDKRAVWNEMQQYVYDYQEESLIVIGQTGLGKTEAGLRWIGDHKGFFTLPLKTAINAIYQRIRLNIADVAPEKYQKQVGLLHSDSFSVLLSESEHVNTNAVAEIDSYLSETRSWSLPLTVTTLDQTFDFVYHYPGFERKLATFSYAKVVIDEIQMYSPDLLAYLIKGLKEIQEYGGKFLIMTATLPAYLLDLFQKNGLVWKMNPKPFLDEELLERHHLKVLPEELTAEEVVLKYRGGKLLVICNTIRKAKEIYEGLKNQKLKVPIKMIHSQFTRQDRQAKELEIIDFAHSNNEGIWIATQVVEASLDIDFDLLLTELSELNGLFQRMGRCYRNRALENREEANVYVYDGGEKLPSGVSRSDRAVVHLDIFNRSKEALHQSGDGVLDESRKMQLIEETYTTENMKDTLYFEQITNMIGWLDAIENDGLDKREVQRLFRNIQSRDVIPEEVYKENQQDIDRQLDILSTSNQAFIKNGETKSAHLKKLAKIQLEKYMMSLPEYLFQEAQRNGAVRYYELDQYLQVLFIKGEYRSEVGFSLSKSEEDDNLF